MVVSPAREGLRIVHFDENLVVHPHRQSAIDPVDPKPVGLAGHHFGGASDGTVLAAACVVVAAGGWAGAIGGSRELRDVLAPTRRHLLVTAVDARVDPRWPIVWDDRAGFYARPESGGWLVMPDSGADAPSMASTPASIAAR